MSDQSTHPFTCNTCQVAFRSSDLQRTHMQSDWHRYNLKRRVASLPPLSSEIFAEKVLANKATAAATAARASFEKGCEVCQKTYFSENAYINHLSSSKHKHNAARAARSGLKDREDDLNSVMSSTFSLGEPIEKIGRDSVDEDAEEEFQEVVDGIKDASLEDGTEPVSRRPTRPHHSAAGEGIPEHPLSPTESNTTGGSRSSRRDPLLECLFCNHTFDTMENSIEHMQKLHGMFIPEREYLVDLEGLVKYLNAKVNEEYECLYCGRLKWSEDGIKTHMRDTDHCKIAYENEDQQLEIGQFYDFRTTYSDSEWDSEEDEEMGDAAPGGGVKLGAKRTAKTTVEGDSENLPDADDDGWATDSTASSVPTEELGRVYLDDQRDEVKERLKQNRHHSHTDTRRHRSIDGFHSHAHTTPHAVYYDEFELHLPSGRTAGHRSLNKYYRQNLHSYPTPEEREQRLLTERPGSDDEEEGEDSKYRGRDRGRQLVSRANGGTGMLGVTAAKRREVTAVQKREEKRAQRQQARSQWKVDAKGNSQKHFRDPLLQ